jgi:hypothetical protein
MYMFVLFRSEKIFFRFRTSTVEMREIMFRSCAAELGKCFFSEERWGKWFSLTGLTDFSSFGFSFAEEKIMNNFLFLFSKEEGKILWLIFNRN